VFAEVSKQLNVKFENAGFLISYEMPHVGVSPDGINKEHILEIKCPEKEKNKIYYVENSTIVPKVRAQMQLSMLLFNREQGVSSCTTILMTKTF